MAWLQHSILQNKVEKSLQVASRATAALQVSWLPVPEQTTSVAVLRRESGPPFTLIIIQVSIAWPLAMCSKAGHEGCRCQGKMRSQRGRCKPSMQPQGMHTLQALHCSAAL